MPNQFQQIKAARERAKRIREYAVAFCEESARMQETTKQTTTSGSLVVIQRESSPKTEQVRPVGRVA